MYESTSKQLKLSIAFTILCNISLYTQARVLCRLCYLRKNRAFFHLHWIMHNFADLTRSIRLNCEYNNSLGNVHSMLRTYQLHYTVQSVKYANKSEIIKKSLFYKQQNHLDPFVCVQAHVSGSL